MLSKGIAVTRFNCSLLAKKKGQCAEAGAESPSYVLRICRASACQLAVIDGHVYVFASSAAMVSCQPCSSTYVVSQQVFSSLAATLNESLVLKIWFPLLRGYVDLFFSVQIDEIVH